MRHLSVVVSLLLLHIVHVIAAIPNVKEMPTQPLEVRIADKMKAIVENQTKALREDFENGISHLKSEMTNNFDLFFSQLNEHSSQLKQLNTKLKHVEEFMARVNARLTSLETEAETQRKADDAARKLTASLASMLITVRGDLVKVGSKLTSVGLQVETLSQQAILRGSDHRHLRSSIQTMNLGLQGVNSKINAVTRRCQQGLSSSKTLTASLRSVEAKVARFDRAIKRISTQMSGVTSTLQMVDGIKPSINSLKTLIRDQCRNSKENITTPVSNFLKQDVLLVDSPTCTRFNKVTVPIEAAAAINSFQMLKDIPDIYHCSNVCSHHHKCLGFWYRDRVCQLFHKSRKHVESVSTNLVDVWLLHHGGLGHCSNFFNIKYRTSKYRLVAKWTTWEDAKNTCHFNGGKLAELTTNAEIHALSHAISTDDHIFVGGVQIGGDEPAGGWLWYQSRIRIPSNGFRWASGQPGNMIFYDEDALIWNPRGNRFHDARYSDRYQFLCECYPLFW